MAITTMVTAKTRRNGLAGQDVGQVRAERRHEYGGGGDGSGARQIDKANAAHGASGCGFGSEHVTKCGCHRQRHASATAHPQRTPDALETFIAGRNALRGKIPSILPHRSWTPADAGTVSFEGRRHLSDGCEAALLKRGDEMLVMVLTPAQAAKADFWARGQELAVDASGRFNAQQRRGGR